MASEDDADDDSWEISDVLDLHTFRPKDVSGLIPDYISECRQRGYTQVRIIHGKGRGTLRRTVHSALDRIGDVVLGYELAEPFAGGWGATIVRLRGDA